MCKYILILNGRHVLQNPALFIGSSGGSGSASLPALVLEPSIGKKKIAYTSFLFS